MFRNLGDLRTLAQAIADLIKRRDEHPHPSSEREQLERMIRDLQAEIAIRNKARARRH
jgi:RNA polymerase-interacting CarD/CdnL/TRCF family regulator